MLVDVVELNYHGSRIPREYRKGLPCVRGRISVERLLSHQALDNAPVHAHIVPPRLEPLYGVKLRYWRGQHLVLVGNQRTAIPGKRAETSYEQVWWCRIVTDQVPSAPDPS